MIPKELIKKIKKIEIKSNKIVNQIFSGEYHSVFKGNGMEFEDIREYYPGDDIRNIDWNVTARQNRAYIKKFREERELNLFLLVDMSSSNNFGKKKDIIAEISATIAFSAVKNNDKVGSLIFTDKVEKLIPSKKGKKHVLSIIENLLYYKPENKGTNISKAIDYFNDIEKKRSIVFIISDFFDEDISKKIKMISKKHDVILIRVIERSEEIIPKGAIFTFEDLETGEEYTFENYNKDIDAKASISLSSKNMLTVYTDEDFIKPLMLFFKRRMRK